MTTETKTLVDKMAEVMHEVGYVQYDAQHGVGYGYASAKAVLKKVNAALSERGIAVSSAADLVHYSAGHAVVKLSLTFNDGTDSLTVEGLGEGKDNQDKATMKANTAALKYAMANAFMISWGDDPENDDAPEPDPSKIADWIADCEEASGGPIEEYRQWYNNHVDQIKRDCGAAWASRIYDKFVELGKKVTA